MSRSAFLGHGHQSLSHTHSTQADHYGFRPPGGTSLLKGVAQSFPRQASNATCLLPEGARSLRPKPIHIGCKSGATMINVQLRQRDEVALQSWPCHSKTKQDEARRSKTKQNVARRSKTYQDGEQDGEQGHCRPIQTHYTPRMLVSKLANCIARRSRVL